MKRIWVCLIMVLVSFSSIEAKKRKVSAAPLQKSSEHVVSKEQAGALAEATHTISFEGNDAFNPEKKRQDVIDLVQRGVEFFEKQSAIQMFDQINNTHNFRYGELFLFIYDATTGTCLARGKDLDMLWKNFMEQRDAFGLLYIKKMIDQAQIGGGWVTYESFGATKASYVKMVKKDEKKYLLGCGYFSHTKEDAVVALVRGAVSTFYTYVDRGSPVEDAFSDFSFPAGKFVAGELYIYVLDKDLVIRANGFDPSEVGISYWDSKDAKGTYYLRQIPEKLAEVPVGEGRWVEFEYYNAPERDYAERVVDKKGTSYFIVCGYNPYADRPKAIELTQRGIAAIKERGLTAVAGAINDVSNQEFVYGRMMLFIYDFEGNVIANGERPGLAGKNSINDRDDAGSLYVKELLDRVKTEKKAWISFLLKKSIVSMYCQETEVGGKKYVVGTRFFPVSKESATVLLVKNAKKHLESVRETKAFRAFDNEVGAYMIGDLTVFVYGMDGTCYADGSEVKNVWRNRLDEKDEDGRFFVKTMIDMGKTGPTKVIFRKNGARMVSYVEPVKNKKGDKTFIVGSGYCL